MIAGAPLVALGALLLYASARHQRLRRVALRGSAGSSAGVAALAGGLALLLRWAGPATAVFIALTIAMLVWSTVPVVAAYARRPRGR